MSEPETAPVQMPVAPDPEAREFRDRGMEADRQEFMGRKETVMSEPVPGPAPLPFPEDVGECLVCTNPDCNGATEGDEPRWSPLAISPQGRWKLEAGAWFHICSYGKFGEAVNPFAAEGP